MKSVPNNSKKSNIIIDPESASIKGNQQLTITDTVNSLKVEIPQRRSNYYPYDQDELIDINTEIEMMTEDLQENYFDDLLNKADISLLQIETLIEASLIYFIEGLHVSLTGLIFIPILKHYKLSEFNSCIVSSSLILFMAFGSLSSGVLT